MSPFCVIEGLDLKRVLNTPKAIMSFMECVDVATLSWAIISSEISKAKSNGAIIKFVLIK